MTGGLTQRSNGGHCLTTRLETLSETFALAVAGTLAITLQILWTQPFGDTGVRIGASDLLLPILFVAAAVSWRSFGKAAGQMQPRSIWIWLAGLTLWIVVSLLVGRLAMGTWQSWAVVNKAGGWLVVLGYFAIGVWLGTEQGTRDLFLRVFLVTGWIASVVSLGLFALFKYGVQFPMTGAINRLEGFSANPNAFAIVVACQLALQMCLVRREILFPRWLHCVGMAIGLLALLYAGSRSAWVGFAFAAIILLSMRRLPLREASVALLLALAINTLLLDLHRLDLPRLAPTVVRELWATVEQDTAVADPAPAVWDRRSPYLYIARAGIVSDPGAQDRVEMTKRALRYWRERPIVGVGLGDYMWQSQRDGYGANAPHSTGLWLLTEMGLVGFLMFLAFFLVCLRALVWRQGRFETNEIRIGIAATMLVLAGSSIGTEVLYQRYLWVLLGIGLAANSHQRLDDGLKHLRQR